MLDNQTLGFIRSSVKSVWALELLLLMRRVTAHAWAPDQLVKELRSSRTIVTDSLSAFVQAGIVREEENGFRYGPASSELDKMIEQLAAEYAERPITVINVIIEAQNAKLQDFANAFRIKKD